MNNFRQKGSITEEDFMIHIFNNFPKDYNVILDELESCLMAAGENMLTIDVIHEKLNHRKSKKKRH